MENGIFRWNKEWFVRTPTKAGSDKYKYGMSGILGAKHLNFDKYGLTYTIEPESGTYGDMIIDNSGSHTMMIYQNISDNKSGKTTVVSGNLDGINAAQVELKTYNSNMEDYGNRKRFVFLKQLSSPNTTTKKNSRAIPSSNNKSATGGCKNIDNNCNDGN